MNVKRQLIVKGRKFDEVMEGGRKVFLRDGFERASVDDTAKEEAAPKATLHAYFPEKRILFMEIALAECHRQAEEAAAQIELSAPIDVILHQTGIRIIEFMRSDVGQRIYRIAVAETERFPDLAMAFYRSGPLMAKERIGKYLRIGVQRGELDIDDIPLAAAQFAQFCKVDLHDRSLFDANAIFNRNEGVRACDAAPRMFMARYGKRH